jgi:hypothetical protein
MIEVKMPFGVVHYASGKTKHPVYECIRDWAVVKLSDDRFKELPLNIVSH